jgi:hypothetical protein
MQITGQRTLKSVGLVLIAAYGSSAVYGAEIQANPSDYRAKLDTMVAGDVLVLAPGTYTEDLPLGEVQGTADKPFIIRGPEDRSAVFKGRSCCNTIQFDESSYIEVRNLTLDGQHLPEPFGVDSGGWSHHITIENMLIVNYDADQAMVGISTKAPAWNWTVRRNTIIGAGTGMYFGNSDGNAPFVAGLIEYNVVLDTLGYSLQVKQQNPRPTNIGMPTGNSRTIIRHNVFSKLNNASGGALARPNLLVGHFPLTGTGSNDLYEIYGNFIYANNTEALFQGEGNIALYDNVFVNPYASAVHIMPHNDSPRTVDIFHNTVVALDNGIRVTGGAAGFTQRIFGNASYAGVPISGPNQSNNVTGTYNDALANLVAPHAQPGTLSVFPKAGKLSGTAIDLTPLAAFTDGNRDFNGDTRAGMYRGAYEGEGANGGWQLDLSQKPTTNGGPPPPPAPTLNFTATPSTVTAPGTTNLQWTSTSATGCTASGGWTGSKSASGSQTSAALTANTTYTLTCTGAGGTVARSASVTVTQAPAPAPTVSLSASPSTVATGGSTTLTWQATNATSCTASNGWTGTKALSGTQSVGPLQSTTQYRLDCDGAGGSAMQNLTVNVTGTTTSPPDSPEETSGGGGGNIPWTTVAALALGIGARFARPAARA